LIYLIFNFILFYFLNGGLDLQNAVDEILAVLFDRHFMIKRLTWAVENLQSVSVCRHLRNLHPRDPGRWAWRSRLLFEKTES